MSFLRVFVSVLFLSVAGFFSGKACASPSHSIQTQESRIVEKIEIQVEQLPLGTVFDTRPLIDKLKTKVGAPFSHVLFDTDLKMLSEKYDRMVPRIDISPEGGLLITIQVWARPIISSLVWGGNHEVGETILKRELGVKTGTTFDRGEFNRKLNKVREYYLKKGYFESHVSYKVQPIPETNEVNIYIRVVEGRAGVIDEISFIGFSEADAIKVLDMIQTKPYRLLTSWFSGTGRLQEEMIEHDRLAILNFFHNHGYADVKLEIEIKDSVRPGRVVVVFKLEKGPVFRYQQVTFRGNTLFTDQEIERVFLIHPDECYSLQGLHDTTEAIKSLYGRHGYIEAHIQYETELVEDQPFYNVHFEIEEGVPYKIGLIRIVGNQQTSPNVILRESLLVPGEILDSVKLKATQERLQNIGYFKSVNVYAIHSQDEELGAENYRDVYIEVEEAPTGHAGLFFGFSSGDGIFGGLDVTETNFNCKGFLTLPKEGVSSLRGGGEYAHAKVTIGSKQRTYLVSWLTPYLRDSLWRFGFDAFLNQSQLQAKKYEIDSVGGSMFLSYPLSPYWTVGTKYRAKHAKIDVSHSASRKEQKAEKGTGNISAMSVSLNYDSTDQIDKPHRGLRTLFELEFAGLGGDFDFLKYSYVNSYYQPLWRLGTMKYRWEVRFIQPILSTSSPGDIPLSERFFIGGENSVRGYKTFGLGPVYPSGDPQGGIGYSVLSLEYLQQILSVLDAFLFIDAGSISLKTFSLPGYQMSYGVGLRIEVMRRIPVTVGIGFPVNPEHDGQVKKFFFSMGGQF